MERLISILKRYSVAFSFTMLVVGYWLSSVVYYAMGGATEGQLRFDLASASGLAVALATFFCFLRFQRWSRRPTKTTRP